MNTASSTSVRPGEYLPSGPVRATFWRQATEGTNYWRLLLPARHLPGRVNEVLNSDTENPDPVARQEGVAIWQFLGDLHRTRFAARVQSEGVPCLMEVDDNYLVPAPHMPGRGKSWVSTVRQSFEAGESGYSHQAHRMILPSLDGLIVSTDELANRYDGLTRHIHVCPNSVDPDDWPKVTYRRRDFPVVGYAGSDSHYYDLTLIERALDWAARHTKLAKLGADIRVWRWEHEQVPWTNDLEEYRRNLQKVDIGLCPLKRSNWHDCKSDIKAMEYLMAGAIPIVQADSPCYRDWINLVPSASTPKQWEKAVQEVVLMSHDEREKLWRRAYEWLLKHKTIEGNIQKWRAIT